MKRNRLQSQVRQAQGSSTLEASIGDRTVKALLWHEGKAVDVQTGRLSRASIALMPEASRRLAEKRRARHRRSSEGEVALKDASKKIAPTPKRDDPSMLRAIFLVLALSFAALSACKQADPDYNPYSGISFDGGK